MHLLSREHERVQPALHEQLPATDRVGFVPLLLEVTLDDRFANEPLSIPLDKEMVLKGASPVLTVCQGFSWLREALDSEI